jgi:hypothetical protein
MPVEDATVTMNRERTTTARFVSRPTVEFSYFYSFGDLSGRAAVLAGQTFTIWNEAGGCGPVFRDIAECRTNVLGQVRAYNHDCLSEDRPGTLGPWVSQGCSVAEEFGFVVGCCVGPVAGVRGFDPATFTATFYNGTDLTGTSFTRRYTEPIDFLRTCWDEVPPYAGCKLVEQLDDGNDYSVRWNGRLLVPANGEYVFIFANVDDGARLFLDGTERADNGWYWPAPDRRPSPRRISLTAGWHNIRIDYEQRVYAAASLQVRWSGPGFAEEVIPLAGASGVTPVSLLPQPIESK